MQNHRPAKGMSLVWTVRFLIAGLLLTVLLAAFPKKVFLWGTAAVWCVALLLSVYAAVWTRSMRWKMEPGRLLRSSGVFWRKQIWVCERDVQAAFYIQTPLMTVFGLYTVGLLLPGKTVWLDGLTRREKEAFPWR